MFSQLVEQDCHLSNVEENVMFALVGYVTRKVLSHTAMPVWSIVTVEELLDALADILLGLAIVNSVVNLLFDIILHVLIHFTNDPGDASFSHI